MALTTQAKRGAALGFSSPLALLPFPDGTVNNDDFYVLLGLYPFDASPGDTSTQLFGRFGRMGRRRAGVILSWVFLLMAG